MGKKPTAKQEAFCVAYVAWLWLWRGYACGIRRFVAPMP